MTALPSEIIEHVLSFCDDQLLAIRIPRVSKLFKKLSNDNGSIWRAKCGKQKYFGSDFKLSDQTWKQYYFETNNNRSEPLNLFPLCGFTIAKTPDWDLTRAPGAQRSPIQIGARGTMPSVMYQGYNFWIMLGTFIGMDFNRQTELPKEWIAQGLNWDLSFAKLKELFRRKNGNYKVIKAPGLEHRDYQSYYVAKITSIFHEIIGEDEIYYDSEFNFEWNIEGPPTVDMPGTLKQFKIFTSWKNKKQRLAYYKETYNNKECLD